MTVTQAKAIAMGLGEELPPRGGVTPPAGFEISFDVRGKPLPQGSLVRSPTGGMYHAHRKELLDWRIRIAEAAELAMAGLPPVSGPVEVGLTFRIRRPANHFLPANRKRPEPVLRHDAPTYVTSAPDADKLLRAALDALSAVAFGDDAQVAELGVTKRYANPDEGPGVAGSVRSLEVPS